MTMTVEFDPVCQPKIEAKIAPMHLLKKALLDLLLAAAGRGTANLGGGGDTYPLMVVYAQGQSRRQQAEIKGESKSPSKESKKRQCQQGKHPVGNGGQKSSGL